MITSNREEHGLILDVHRAGIGDGRLQVGHIDIDVNAVCAGSGTEMVSVIDCA